MQVPSKPIQPEYPTTYSDTFQTLFSGTGIHFANEGINISRESHLHGYCLYAFDLTPDLSANSNAL